MKMNKKKVLVVALAVSLIAILSLGSIAWFNAKDEITNKFQVATSDDGAPDFSIDVKEHETDAAGKEFVLDSNNEKVPTDTGNTYQYVVPGDEILKDPYITNTGDYDQWVRVNILISKTFADQVARTQNKAVADLDFTTLFKNFNTGAFETAREFSATAFADYYMYSYYVATKVAPDATVNVFEAVNIPTTFTQAEMSYGGFQIIVKADAIQSDNLGSSASDAFDTVDWEAGTAYDLSIVE